MSRSYKKHAYCGDKKDKELKRLANHRVRQYLKRNPEVTLRPSQFKHLFESWKFAIMVGFVIGKNIGIDNWNGIMMTITNAITVNPLHPTLKKNIVIGITIIK